MPTTADFVGDAANAVWSTRDRNAEGIRDFLTNQSRRVGYTVYEVTQSAAAIYEVILVKGANAFSFNITRGLQATVIRARRVGMMRVRLSGAANGDLDLPLRETLDLRAGSEIFIGTSLPNDQCARCEYLAYVHIAPFKGIGTYSSKPAGNFLIDAWVIPGGNPDAEDYRWAQDCTVVIQDAFGGSFDCKQLVNTRDDSKHIDIRGSWQQP